MPNAGSRATFSDSRVSLSQLEATRLVVAFSLKVLKSDAENWIITIIKPFFVVFVQKIGFIIQKMEQ